MVSSYQNTSQKPFFDSLRTLSRLTPWSGRLIHTYSSLCKPRVWTGQVIGRINLGKTKWVNSSTWLHRLIVCFVWTMLPRVWIGWVIGRLNSRKTMFDSTHPLFESTHRLIHLSSFCLGFEQVEWLMWTGRMVAAGTQFSVVHICKVIFLCLLLCPCIIYIF